MFQHLLIKWDPSKAILRVGMFAMISICFRYVRHGEKYSGSKAWGLGKISCLFERWIMACMLFFFFPNHTIIEFRK